MTLEMEAQGRALSASAKPNVDGALLAIRKVPTLVGIHRGLDAVLDL